MERNLARARAVQATEMSAPEKLRTLITELMESYAENFPFLYVYIQENLSQMARGDATWADRMRQTNREYEAVVVEIVKSGYRDATIREIGPAWVVAYGIIGLVGWTNRWFDPSKSTVDDAAIGATYAEMVITGLVAD